MANAVDQPRVSSDDDPPTVGQLVFISHDSRDAKIAEAFSRLIASVTAGMLKTFRSSDKKGSQGFEYGVEWFPELMKTLASACDVVCLLTKHSLERPWILYEAGVAKGKLEIPVHGLALGVPLAKASTGPFAQFQNCDDDVDSITKLAIQLIRRLPHADPDQDMVKSQVEVFKETIRLVDASDDEQPGELSIGDASSSKLFEEIKVMFQDLPARLERVVTQPSRESRPRIVRQPVGVIHELLLRTGEIADGRPGVLMMTWASFLRDDAPWLYEMGVMAYRAALARDSREASRLEIQVSNDFMRAAELTLTGPFARDLRISRGEEMFAALRSALRISAARYEVVERAPDDGSEGRHQNH